MSELVRRIWADNLEIVGSQRDVRRRSRQLVRLLAGVFAGGVTMSLGMLVHEASVLIVIVNGMRLLRGADPAAHATMVAEPSQAVATTA